MSGWAAVSAKLSPDCLFDEEVDALAAIGKRLQQVDGPSGAALAQVVHVLEELAQAEGLPGLGRGRGSVSREERF